MMPGLDMTEQKAHLQQLISNNLKLFDSNNPHSHIQIYPSSSAKGRFRPATSITPRNFREGGSTRTITLPPQRASTYQHHPIRNTQLRRCSRAAKEESRTIARGSVAPHPASTGPLPWPGCRWAGRDSEDGGSAWPG